MFLEFFTHQKLSFDAISPHDNRSIQEKPEEMRLA